MKPAKKKQSQPKSNSFSSPKSNAYHHGNLREEVLEHSRKVLESKGVSSLSLRDIATDLGVSHTAPYRHFPKKMDLLQALVAEGFLELSEGMKRAWEASEDPLEKIKKAGVEYIFLLLKNPRRTELMFGGEIYVSGDPISDELSEFGKAAYMGMFRIVEYGQKLQKLKNTIPTDTLMMSFWSGVHGFAVLNERKWKQIKSQEEEVKFRKEVDQILDIMIEGTRL
ncbi:TetR/AcrR family transcriptional regulator [Leptospira sp. 2 VSF19]|uniref:TetR/AcrR family transcriptional regulator n=1 Tax=Leptospira soteropolitanensis TaxID=2950025 RepID=A0AAW5V776_9LEPT|nr:TetR/AcrR family transcriptional regulator [Leptospira soteropolitanensis]MCW7491153.1 TetR/AcrR family transcriptional regulator [Leptospira soteropolitanensis]MCW7498737.1 TetR/AcrR family transcriptional regulator [Leptospira soteropolitanensis]MCW7521670.1 TetR/AcrR family transcriptional regulator [Leptospira soteropolitanensis]MCW7524841.1 TetR/AcrR family transcriptional regulator [Leptospira soteropolitanensis]MCW7528708.1 TetR/AcrR family transcriptional regulator [Leptospira soter